MFLFIHSSIARLHTRQSTIDIPEPWDVTCRGACGGFAGPESVEGLPSASFPTRWWLRGVASRGGFGLFSAGQFILASLREVVSPVCV